jgi:predicted CXXCH cytochrome family protein
VHSAQPCLDCHEETSQELKTGKRHAPFSQKNCAGCHNPHASRYDKFLIRPKEKLCFNCHEEKTIIGNENIHAPVAKGDCLICHSHHSSAIPKLLKAKVSDLCFNCHEQEAFKGNYRHAPVAQGNCLTCHAAHSSPNVALLKKKPEQVCSTCHDYGKGFQTAHLGYPAGGSNCLSCHASHVSEAKGLMNRVVHAPFAARKCQTCHKGKKEGGNLRSSWLCLSCHQDIKETFQRIESHLAAMQVGCVSCHSPHASPDKGLLGGDEKTVCYSCHTDSKARTAKANSVHPDEGRPCLSCHAGHGSDYPVMMRADGNKVCNDCHKLQGSFSHPVGEKFRDMRTDQPIECTTCHDPMGTADKAQLRMEADRLCLECHYRE